MMSVFAVWMFRPRLDDGGAHQHVGAALPEVEHHLFQFRFPHLAVGGDHAGLRHQVAQLGSHLVDALDAVVDEEHLPSRASSRRIAARTCPLS